MNRKANNPFGYSMVASAVLFALSPAVAEEGLMLEEVVVVGSVAKAGQIEYLSPRSVQTIGAETLQDRTVHQLDEALHYQAGVNAQVYGADLDSNDWLKMRGFSPSVFIDGTGIYKGGYFGWDSDMYGVETIEMVKGADSFTYGSAQTGGLINLVSKRPTAEPKGEVSFTLGSRNERGISGDWSSAVSENVRFRLVGNYNKRDGETQGTWQERYYFAPSVTWDISPKTHITFLASTQKDAGVPTTSFFPKYSVLQQGHIDRRTNYSLGDNNRLDRVQNTLGYEWTHKFDNGISISQNYRFAHSDKTQFATSYSYMLDEVNAAKGSVYANATTKSHTLDNRVSYTWKTDRIENTLFGGVDYQHHRIRGVYGYGVAGTVNVFQPQPTYAQIPNVPTYRDNQRQLGVYLQNQFRFDNKLALSMGVRRDFAKADTDSLNAKTRYNIQHNSYSAGAMYTFDSGIAPYVNYSESFRPISGNDGSVAYKPYEGKQYEAGVKYLPSFLDGSISLAYFDLTEKNALVNGNGGVATQAGKQISRGVELQADLALTDTLSTTLAYTYTKAKTEQKVDVPMQPRHSYAAMLNYHIKESALAGLTLGAGVRYTGTTNDELGNPGIKVPARTLVDLSAKYRLNANWEARVNVTNLTNKRYISSCFYSCYYGEGRKVTANVAYKW